jgi:hypothetical protein
MKVITTYNCYSLKLESKMESSVPDPNMKDLTKCYCFWLNSHPMWDADDPSALTCAYKVGSDLICNVCTKKNI